MKATVHDKMLCEEVSAAQTSKDFVGTEEFVPPFDGTLAVRFFTMKQRKGNKHYEKNDGISGETF